MNNIIDSMDNDIIDINHITNLSLINEIIDFGYIVDLNISTFDFIEIFIRRFYNKETHAHQLLFLERLLIMSFYENNMISIASTILDNIGLPHIGSLEFVESIPFKDTNIPLTKNIDFIHNDDYMQFYWNTMKLILIYTGNSDVIILIHQLLIAYNSFIRNRIYSIIQL